MDPLTLADFEPALHSVFTIQLNQDEQYALELVEIRDLGDAPGPEFRKPFALTFRNERKSAYLPQGTYRLEHDQMGSVDLFIVPLGPNAAGMLYEVVFG